VWAAHAGELSGGGIVINQADIQDGLGAASAVGDDTIQGRTQGRVVPDSFTHGTSAQRMKWFTRGYERGEPAACDTFSGAI
jgi:predicted metalloprotease